jgi:hypothetical protein
MPQAQKNILALGQMLLQMQAGKLETNVWGHKQLFFTCDEMKVLLEDFFTLGH